MKGLLITGFPEKSIMKDAGAQIDDILTHYNGDKILSIKHLEKLKSENSKELVEVILLRKDKEIKLNISSGFLGVFLKELIPEHGISKDAVIIEGIGKLGWGLGMENSFLACIYLMERKFGKLDNYIDVLGLSGYGFRFMFHPDFCSSAPDATVPRNVGAELLAKLGYKYACYYLDTELKTEDKRKRSRKALREIIKESILSGWPVFAIDLIQVPEWGLITGFQNHANDFFCRTYFDKTEGYEIAEKFPWSILVIVEKDNVDLVPLFKKSLQIAKEMYQTKSYEEYFSGLEACNYLQEKLKDSVFFENSTDEEKLNKMHANWWIYVSLLEARALNIDYLRNNKDKFGMPEETIEKIILLLNKEVNILKEGMPYVPSHWVNPDIKIWTQNLRNNQAKIIERFADCEKSISEYLNII
ncbi:MAG: hypothetical protein PHV06_00570 [bacterium]|nr:hypothetical protein [bacterium]